MLKMPYLLDTLDPVIVQGWFDDSPLPALVRSPEGILVRILETISTVFSIVTL